MDLFTLFVGGLREHDRAVTAISALVLILAGCFDPYAPSRAEVTGRVTLNGSPLQDAVVTFTPEDGAASEGRTDADGKFRLADSEGRSGAVIGRHHVRVVTEHDVADSATGFDSGAQLRRDVLPGENRFELALSPTVPRFTGRLTRGEQPITFDPVDSVLLRLLYRATGESFGVPLDSEGAFEVGWMPVGEYTAILARGDSAGAAMRPGAPGTFMIPGGLTIRAGQTEYEIDVGNDWSPQILEAPPPGDPYRPLDLHRDG